MAVDGAHKLVLAEDVSDADEKLRHLLDDGAHGLAVSEGAEADLHYGQASGDESLRHP